MFASPPSYFILSFYVMIFSLALLWYLAALVAAQCPDYVAYSGEPHGPYSSGRYNLSYQRPDPACRTLAIPDVETKIVAVKEAIADPDLARLFENTYPNTLDTAIRWRGTAAGSDEELAFIITGDINAMWLRDSANQMKSYLSLLKSANGALATLFRGVINLQARYVIKNPYCNSFQPPVESGIDPTTSGAGASDTVFPPYDIAFVFECKYELDSLAAFLQISAQYYAATKDLAFFGKYKWMQAVQSVLTVAEAMKTPTYATDGSVNASPYTWRRQTDRATETLANDGLGNPVSNLSGLIRSAFRPSDDATIYQGFIPANMLFSVVLSQTAQIMAQLPNGTALAQKMSEMSACIRDGIQAIGITKHTTWGKIYAYETDGYGSHNIMDDANIPSLLSAPFIGFTSTDDVVYKNTRAMILSKGDPYFMRGPGLSAGGGPHNGPGYAWPMASIVRILTSDNVEGEIVPQLKSLVGSTAGLGLIHESVWSFNQTKYTRPW